MTRRPGYHLTAPTNWLNDPNGLIHHDGRHHVFYQHNPHAPEWGPPCWGHYSSTDLITWAEHPIALRPDPDGPDRDGCWSGCVTLVDGRPIAFYTGVIGGPGPHDVRLESICRADGSPDLVDWHKDTDNPLVAGAPDDLGTCHHRDPFVFRRADRWSMLLGSAIASDGVARGGAVVRYDSSDLRSWTYGGVVFQRPPGGGLIDTGAVWECPQLLEFDDRDVLVFSVSMPDHPFPLRYAVYAVGALTDAGFRADRLGMLDHGDVFYAPAVMRVPDGRYLAWGWLQERTPAVARGADHSGALSLPRTLELSRDELVVRPVRELTGLRTRTTALGDVGDGARSGLTTAVDDPHVEIEATITGRSGSAEIAIGDDAGAGRSITVDRARRRVRVADRTGTADACVAEIAPGSTTRLRVFVDATIVEVFVDDTTALTVRNDHPPPTEVQVCVRGDAAVRDIVAHTLVSSITGG